MELKMTPYNHVYYKNCFYNPLLTGIYYCGGNDLPFLANDFFSYKINDQSILLLNTQNHNPINEFSLIETMGITVTPIATGNDFVSCLKQSIDQQMPIFLPIDNFYHTSEHYAEGYLRDHNPHYLLVVGYDEARELVLAYDMTNKQTQYECYKEEIRYEDIAKAAQSYRELYRHMEPFGMRREKLNYPFLDVDNQAERFRQNYISLADCIEESLECLLTIKQEYRAHFERWLTDFSENPDHISRDFALTERSKLLERYQLEVFDYMTPQLAELNERIYKKLFLFHRIVTKMMLGRKYDSAVENYLEEIYGLEKQWMRAMEESLSRPVKAIPAENRVAYKLMSHRWNLKVTVRLSGRPATIRLLDGDDEELSRFEIGKSAGKLSFSLIQGKAVVKRQPGDATFVADCRVTLTAECRSLLTECLVLNARGEIIDGFYWELSDFFRDGQEVGKVELISGSSAFCFSEIQRTDRPEITPYEQLPQQSWMTPEEGWYFYKRGAATEIGFTETDERRAIYAREKLTGNWSIETTLRILSGRNEKGLGNASIALYDGEYHDCFRIEINRIETEYMFELKTALEGDWRSVELPGLDVWCRIDTDRLHLRLSRVAEDLFSLWIQSDPDFRIVWLFRYPDSASIVCPALFAYRTEAAFDDIHVYTRRLSDTEYLKKADELCEKMDSWEFSSSPGSRDWGDVGLEYTVWDSAQQYLAVRDRNAAVGIRELLFERRKPMVPLQTDLDGFSLDWGRAMSACMEQWIRVQDSSSDGDVLRWAYRWFQTLLRSFSDIAEERDGLWYPVDDGCNNKEMSIEAALPLLLGLELCARLPEVREELETSVDRLLSGIERNLGRKDGGYWSRCDYRGPALGHIPYGEENGEEASPIWGNWLMFAVYARLYEIRRKEAFRERAERISWCVRYLNAKGGIFPQMDSSRVGCALALYMRYWQPDMAYEDILHTATKRIAEKKASEYTPADRQLILSAGLIHQRLRLYSKKR